ncbi:diguanylate cyclase domain-containing protein [Candidatus Nitrospira bockiana]
MHRRDIGPSVNMDEYDALTGLPTEGYLHGLLDETWCSLDGTVFSIVSLMVPGLADFVKQYGQQTGDECVKRMAAAAQRVPLPPGSRLARYGPDRFVIMLPGATQGEAAAVAAAVDQEINALELTLTVSARIATGTTDRYRSSRSLLMQAIGLGAGGDAGPGDGCPT